MLRAQNFKIEFEIFLFPDFIKKRIEHKIRMSIVISGKNEDWISTEHNAQSRSLRPP